MLWPSVEEISLILCLHLSVLPKYLIKAILFNKFDYSVAHVGSNVEHESVTIIVDT